MLGFEVQGLGLVGSVLGMKNSCETIADGLAAGKQIPKQQSENDVGTTGAYRSMSYFRSGVLRARPPKTLSLKPKALNPKP